MINYKQKQGIQGTKTQLVTSLTINSLNLRFNNLFHNFIILC